LEAENPSTAPKSREILDRVRAVFSEKGFDGASMQDLARAAAMSAGNFYRYFPSKAAIVEALVQRNLEEAELDFHRIRHSADPRRAVRDTIRKHVEAMDCEKGAIWCEIQSTAFRRPEIAALMERMESHMCRNIIEVFAQITGVPPAVAEARFAPQARLIMMLIQGLSAMKARNEADPLYKEDRQLAALVIETIENIVDNLPGVETDAEPAKKAG
jgi:AcrR family transcriptional regulator